MAAISSVGSVPVGSPLRAFWTEQVHVEPSGIYAGKWLRLAGSFEGYDEDYEDLLAAHPEFVASADGGSIYIPMTAANLPAPQIVTHSSTDSPSNNPGWKAFDGQPSTAWRCTGGLYTAATGGSTGSEWVQIDLGDNPLTCVACSVTPAVGDSAHAPKDLQLLGANVDTNWAAATSLMSVTGVTDPNQIIEFTNTAAFRYLRLLVTRIQGAASTNVYIGEIGLFAAGKALINTADTAGTVTYVKVADRSLIPDP